jgi:hypothetical protein
VSRYRAHAVAATQQLSNVDFIRVHAMISAKEATFGLAAIWFDGSMSGDDLFWATNIQT